MTIQRYAILGWPIHHSLSPQLQLAGFKALGIHASYKRVSVHPKAFATSVNELRDRGFRGWNISSPYKGAICQFLDVIESNAALAQSVNTVVNKDGKLYGYSTDGYGLATAIKQAFSLSIQGKTFTFWGTGATTRAAAIYFVQRRCTSIILVNRTPSKAKALAAILRRLNPDCRIITFSTQNFTGLKASLPASDVLIQATVLGLNASDPISIPKSLLTPNLDIYDMNYVYPTRLSNYAASIACRVHDGRSMLLHQGMKSLALWTGKKDMHTTLEAMQKVVGLRPHDS